MDGRINPTTTLREQNGKLVGHGCLAYRLGNKDLFTLGEGPEHER